MAKQWKTMDGNMAAAHVSYAFTEVAAIYPITPSSNMAEYVDEWASHGRKNIFGKTVRLAEMQSEAGAAGAVHGSLSAGSLTSTFTASQGLLLMIPNMYKIAGELLPGVFNVSARAVAGHALSIFGDHSDVTACRGTGFAMLASGSVQETMDLTAVAHLASIRSSIPFLNFFDGFRTSHEIQKIEVLDYDDLAELVDWDAIRDFKERGLNPEHPYQKGTAQNPDIFFQAKEAANRFYDDLPEIVEDYMKQISKLTGRHYAPFNYYGDPEAERVMIVMGSATEAAEETVDYLMARGEKVGVLKVHLYRPFSARHFFEVLPASVKRIAVLDRTKEAGALGEPLYEDVCALFNEKDQRPLIVGGRYGLGSNDTTPSWLKTVFDNLKLYEPKNHFTIGIVDDVTRLSLELKEEINAAPEGTIRCKFWGLGSDGTVGANKNAIKIIGDNTEMYAQGYFSYDSKKSGGITVSHLRFGKKPIKSTYLIKDSDFVACHKQEYVHQYDVLDGLKNNGTFLLNTQWTDIATLEEHLPGNVKRALAEKEIDFYVINGTDLGTEIGLGNRINMIMMSAFFKLAKVIPYEDAIKYMKDANEKTYGRKGEKIVAMNDMAVDKGADGLIKIEIPASWKDAEDCCCAGCCGDDTAPDFIQDVCRPMNAQKGDTLTVSAFMGREDGSFPNGTSAYEKRGVAIDVPEWIMDKCIQCNQCAMVCPHASIRPILLDGDEMADAPEGFEVMDAKGKELEGLKFRMQVSPLDCMGCGNCADICPVKALEMKPIATQTNPQTENWDFAVSVSDKSDKVNVNTVKGSQFAQPYLEFSGACAGCGETPYAKLVTQLFGDRMMIANATGCSSIWGGSAPSMPYCTNAKGQGPAWANSLFEDNAEYGYGMALSVKDTRDELASKVEALISMDIDDEVKGALQAWLDAKDDSNGSKVAADRVRGILDLDLGCDEANCLLYEIAELEDYLVKKSIWIFGGDGWAYDIGYGGLDHVLASGENVNVLVFDTEVYSNTGGQSSKSTPTAAIAKFAASGKRVSKKDLGRMAMTYGYVYVAQVAMGADKNQLMKALVEAEAYDGPSLIIAYAPCINHGLKEGMGRTQHQSKKAVDAGYWHLYRYNPMAEEEGKNPFTLDSKEPKESFRDFIMSEVRYSSLVKTFPEVAENLFEVAEKDAKRRYNIYKALAQGCQA
ncbi:pyruvate:ferredoxin (flavodoxin) oxidoreductase [Dethiosulfovibrio salsuginis]|uniref:Pyruvate-ferredoxin/flavodoxin oxidoreductase n=1 Tax=Dethiosulfovibrio salsuginis TaxID=561720 RepID=A0A1X7IB66_9BACT|nr:pyruvate:ferredoxin (flavodoxin) oxidoreductase [Dethiosulfovibrio salsuginis]SMG11329.1 pyruvate-ferredoxin/flavodoxin oxidoreductase [Dethiosulfovibrio salsuginis]